jgi:hypothetical protein
MIVMEKRGLVSPDYTELMRTRDAVQAAKKRGVLLGQHGKMFKQSKTKCCSEVY